MESDYSSRKSVSEAVSETERSDIRDSDPDPGSEGQFRGCPHDHDSVPTPRHSDSCHPSSGDVRTELSLTEHSIVQGLLLQQGEE
ncbi:hypothetical protein J6590_023259 [Homalodisca vitripennis]|nr:hypothetical protein J6590_023259 [Homalodisca vitripennis]